MKKLMLAVGLITFYFFVSDAQTQFIQIIQDTTGRFRFQRIQVNEYENFTDSLVVEKFPEKWLDSSELKTYQFALITRHSERQIELRRLFNLEKAETDFHIASLDAIFGAGTYIQAEKEKIKQFLQGAWTLIERNGDTTKTPITITDFNFVKNASKKGTLVITDDGKVILSGYFNFDLTFEIRQDGTLRATRGSGETERLFILRR